MGETSDYTPSSYWSGHVYEKEKKSYDETAGRSYSEAKKKGKKEKDLVLASLTTTSKNPFVFLPDLTGSMSSWPGTLVVKAPYLEHQLKNEYLGEDMEMAFIGVGDAAADDDYPLQVMPFAKGADIKTNLEKLVIEGGGGGNISESYEIAALYLARNVTFPKDAKPIAVFVGDEIPAEDVSKRTAERFSIIMQEQCLSTKEIFQELKTKGWTLFFVRKTPTGNTRNSNENVHSTWVKLVGEDHIAVLDEPERIVDTIFGLLATAKDKAEYFYEEMERRQTLAQQETVYRALKNVLPDRKRLPYTVLTNVKGGKKSAPLLTHKK